MNNLNWPISRKRKTALTWLITSFWWLSSLTGCSLKPIYGQQAAANYGSYLNQITVQPIASIEGVEFYNEMLSLLAPYKSDKYTLKITLTYHASHGIIQKNSDVTRENEKLSVQYTLTDRFTDKILTTGSFQKLSSYSTIFTPYTNDIRHRNIKKNLATTAAVELKSRLLLFFMQSTKQTFDIP